jgi:periplasmic protein TonB
VRFAVSAVIGLAVALALFFVMDTLISRRQSPDREPSSGGLVDFIRIKPDEVTRLKQRVQPKAPPPPKQPPLPPQARVAERSAPQPLALNIEMPQITVPVSTGNGPYVGQWSAGDPAAEGDVIPIVRINPQWPREALLDGVEGWVLVEFTILGDGSVTDPVVRESEPAHLFDREAMRAILKWKFKPRIVDGVAVSRRAVQRIDFVLNQ